jgi:Flp pilus assembly CpaE family ATPase
VSGDVAAALGLPEDTTGVNTIADVARALDGLDPDRLPEVLWTHPAGFHVLPAPAPSSVPDVDEGAVRRVVEAVAAGVDVVVVHVGHGSGRIARWCLGHADRVLEVLTLDVLAFRATSRALALLADVNVSDKLALVVNRARRGQLTAGDVRRVFERSPIGVIPFDASVERRQENGALVGSRTRIGRVVARIADRTVEHAVEGVA